MTDSEWQTQISESTQNLNTGIAKVLSDAQSILANTSFDRYNKALLLAALVDTITDTRVKLHLIIEKGLMDEDTRVQTVSRDALTELNAAMEFYQEEEA